jgi:hypothetical protein
MHATHLTVTSNSIARYHIPPTCKAVVDGEELGVDFHVIYFVDFQEIYFVERSSLQLNEVLVVLKHICGDRLG